MFGCLVILWEVEDFFLKYRVYVWVVSKFEFFF
jgi:hypothetical protein